ncbi:MAG: hypothetical protein GY770_09820 [Aestuariibacter sp.]|nr:hypothetical protein [Aestuariibacter sp.]
MSTSANTIPYFGVDIDLVDTGVDVRINDISIHFNDEAGQLTVEKPAPDSIIDGVNSLSVAISLPYDGEEKMTAYREGVYASATLFRQDLDQHISIIEQNKNKQKLISLTLTVTGDGVQARVEDHRTGEVTETEIELPEDGTASFSTSTTIDSPFPRWAWQDGDTIEDTKANYESLLDTYREIHSLLKAQDLEKLKALYSERAREIAIAYGLDGEEAGHKKLSTGEDMFNDQLKLDDLFLDEMNLEILGNGKLALIHNYFGAQPIFYFQPDPGLLHLYKFMFYRKNNQWIMIR